jgi:hypothetical protein
LLSQIAGFARATFLLDDLEELISAMERGDDSGYGSHDL